jgi:ankyrin repeat protein
MINYSKLNGAHMAIARQVDFNDLPDELIFLISFHSLPEDLFNLILTSKFSLKFSIVAHDYRLWKEKLKIHFPHYYKKSIREITENSMWRKIFLKIYLEEYNGLSQFHRLCFSSIKEGKLCAVSLIDDWLQIKDRNGCSLLYWARKGNHQHILNYIFFNLYTGSLHQNVCSMSHLHWLLLLRRPINEIQSTISMTSNINYVSPVGLTALHIACENDDANIVLSLLNMGANVNCITHHHQHTPLHLALLAKQHAIINLLIYRGADINAATNHGYTPLHIAAGNDDLESISILNNSPHQASQFSHDADSLFPFHLAILSFNVDAVRALMNGDSLGRRSNNGRTALHMAVEIGFEEAVSIFIDFMQIHQLSLINCKDSSGKTALHVAIERNNLVIFQKLLENGADATVSDRKLSPAKLIEHNKQFHHFLILFSLNKYLKSSSGRTAWQTAAAKQLMRAVFHPHTVSLRLYYNELAFGELKQIYTLFYAYKDELFNYHMNLPTPNRACILF